MLPVTLPFRNLGLITSVVYDDGANSAVFFFDTLAPVDGFDVNDFTLETDNTPFNPESIGQNDDHSITADYNGDQTGATDYNFTTANPNFATPQTGPLTPA